MLQVVSVRNRFPNLEFGWKMESVCDWCSVISLKDHSSYKGNLFLVYNWLPTHSMLIFFLLTHHFSCLSPSKIVKKLYRGHLKKNCRSEDVIVKFQNSSSNIVTSWRDNRGLEMGRATMAFYFFLWFWRAICRVVPVIVYKKMMIQNSTTIF